jgi:hypothetical protein
MDWFNERLDLKVRDAIREQLKSQCFGNIEIWRLFGANITLTIWQNYKNPKQPISFIIDFVYFIYFLLLRDILKWRFNKRCGSVKIITNPVVIEAISDEKRFRGLWLPVAEQFNNRDLLLVTPDENIYKKYKSDYNVQIINKFFVFDWFLSRIEILKFIYNNFNFIFFKKIKSPISGLDLLNIYIKQLDYVIRYKHIVQTFKPSCYVTTWDWYYLGSAGTMVFNSNNLPTFTFIHGAGGKDALDEFVPLNADYIFSWGKINTKALIELGVASDSILEVGCPRLKPFKRQEVVLKENFENKMLIILTACINPHFVKDIVKIVEYYSNIYKITIRLHPSTTFDSLQPEIKNLNVHFVTTYDESIEDSILKSEFVISDTTSAAFDVVYLDKPLFVIDSAPIPRPQDIVNEIISYNAAVFCRSFDELILLISNFFITNDLDIISSRGREEFVNDFVSFVESESALESSIKIRRILNP